MSKMIIHNKSKYTDMMALDVVRKVIAKSRFPKAVGEYEYRTASVEMDLIVYSKRNRLSLSFTVINYST